MTARGTKRRATSPLGAARRPGRTGAVKRSVEVVAVVLLALALGACGKKIGDDCKDSVDCNDEDNTRTCDLSQPGGYCTIDGCDEGSCPGESVCVRFFPAMEFLNKSCDPDAATACEPHEVCIRYADGGRCAPRSTESRKCVLKCDGDDDCRDEYVCRTTGEGNAVALTRTAGARARYCSPRGF